MSARIERIAYQIWWLTRDTGGGCTLADLAGFTGASAQSCRNICARRGWGNRYRRSGAARGQDRETDRLQELVEVFG